MSLARNITTVGGATLASRLLGFFRDVGIAAALGAGPLSDAYFAALQIPNLFRRLLAEGALNSAFVPTWLRLRADGGLEAARAFGGNVLGVMAISLGLIALLCMLFAPTVVHLLAPGFQDPGERFPHAVEYVRLSVPYIALAGFVSVAASILNAEHRVGAVSVGLVIFNFVLLGAVILVLVYGEHASPFTGRILSVAIVAAGFAQLLVVGVALIRHAASPRRLSAEMSPQMRRFFAKAIPGVIAGGIPQLKLMAGAMVASSSQAAVSWLYYANRLYELPLGVASTALASVLVPLIAASVRLGEPREIAAAQSRALEFGLGLALPAAVAFAAMAEPIAGGLFERGAFGPHDTAMVAAALAAISAGLPGHVLEKVLGAVSFAHEDTRTPMFTALAGLATAMTGAILLFPEFGHVGIAGAIAGSGWVGALLLALILWRRGWLKVEPMVWRRLAGLALATLVMAGVIVGGQHLLAMLYDVSASALARIVTLAVLVTAGLAVYLAAVSALGLARFADLRAALRRGD